MFTEFNKSLVADGVLYSIKEYITQFKSRFCNDIDISMLNNYYLNSSDSDRFTIKQEDISPTIKIEKIIKMYPGLFEIGIDYIITEHKYEKKSLASSIINLISKDRRIILTPHAFKKIMIMSGNTNYINYFLFTENIIQQYDSYQIMFNKRTLIDSKKKIDELEFKIHTQISNKFISENMFDFSD